MNLRHYKNLVPDTPLHRHLEALLRENGGQLSTLAVCEQVLLMPRTDAEVARGLVGGLGEERVAEGGGGEGRGRGSYSGAGSSGPVSKRHPSTKARGCQEERRALTFAFYSPMIPLEVPL